MNKHKVAVLGASGYAGGELLRYLVAHPYLELAWATADQNAGKLVGEVFGHLSHLSDVELATTDPATVPDVDVAFLALPHGAAASRGRTLADRGIRVVDLSADWRLHDAAAYSQWYDFEHPHPDELASWVYGLPELHRDEISGSSRVASPGCYPTAAVLALAPLLQERLVAPAGIVVDAVSGVSGAGRKVDADYLFSELDASFKAYGVGKHRHTPEIEQELSLAAGTDVVVTFTPHLAPMARGLLATCYAQALGSVGDAYDALATAYKGEPFVRVLPLGAQPATKHASGTNQALIAVGGDERTGHLVITCAIDNLGKGAAGQMIQNANLMLGLEETAGLTGGGVYP
ncbi:MAG: N-acetyl-gamma-glutamyl-phosphate reductase [Actinomycetota bacterium]